MSYAASQDGSISVFDRYWSGRSASTAAASIEGTVAVQIYPTGSTSFSSLAPAAMTRYSTDDPSASGPLKAARDLSPAAYCAYQLLQKYWDSTHKGWLAKIEMHDYNENARNEWKLRFNLTESVVYQIPIRIGDRIGDNSTADGLFLYHEGFEAKCPSLAQLDGDFGEPNVVHNFPDQGWVAMKKGYLRVSELRYELKDYG